MAKVTYLPVIKISRNLRKIIDAAADWEDKGFSHEIACAAGAICLHIDGLERRIKKLEKKNSKQKHLSRIRANKSHVSKFKSTKGG